MSVHQMELRLSTRGDSEMHNLSDDVADIVSGSGVTEGIVTVFIPGSTCGVTTIEFEPGLLQDFPAAMERLAPRDLRYEHDETWHDGNGHSHVRASTIGPSLTVPVAAGKLVLGTWQQIVLVDFDNRSRERRVVVVVMGE